MRKILNSIKKESNSINKIIYWGSVFIIPYLLSFNIQYIQFENIVYTVKWISNHAAPFLLGYSLILLIYCSILCFVRLETATTFIGALTFIFACINFFKCKFRNEPFLPWDLKSSAELSSIMPQLKIEPTKAMFFCFLIYIALIFYSRQLRIKNNTGKSTSIIARSFAFIIIIFFGTQYINLTFYNDKILNKFSMYINNWEQTETYNNNGAVSAFVLNSINLSIEEPKDYSEHTVNKLCDEIKQKSTDENISENKIKRPNIIVIMSEGFWDVTQLPGIEFESELLPTLKELRKNYISGSIFSPKFGGGTSNVEFEALTGFANQFLPPNSVPYEQYILKPTFSTAQYLKSKGYQTLAIHSNNREFWNRNTAYKNMYFDRFIAEDNFDNPELKRGLISDMEVSKKIISEYELNKKSNDKPWFNFTVTMQNHMAYSSDKWEKEDIVKFTAENISDSSEDGLKDLATGLNYSDKALKYLIDYFEGIEDPTIIVFFGDHMNQLGSSTEEIFEATGYLNSDYTELDKSYKLYKTPIVIWNNYTDINYDMGDISSFQIMPEVMKLFNLDMPSYFNFLNEVKNNSRGFARNVVLDNNGKPSYEPNNIQSILYDKLKLIQYDHMFGKRYAEDIFK